MTKKVDNGIININSFYEKEHFMSELINNTEERKKILKEHILQLHNGIDVEIVKKSISSLMQSIPYQEVVDVEQELIAEGYPESEIIELCDLHHQIVEDNILDLSGLQRKPDQRHPLEILKQENQALTLVVKKLAELYKQANFTIITYEDIILFKTYFNQLMDVDKHYRRLEYLLFPYLEKSGITGPPKVLWGKHDETRQLLKTAISTLNEIETNSIRDINALIENTFQKASNSIIDMIAKETNILFPMAQETLKDIEWYEVLQQSLEIGYCLIDPEDGWQPSEIPEDYGNNFNTTNDGYINLSSGQFTAIQLEALLNSLPIDITFVDHNDKVKYFSQGKERIFDRNRSILNKRCFNVPSATISSYCRTNF
ncbi:MAG: DUF438 domain-containing protein [Saprospiraceae bacterium]